MSHSKVSKPTDQAIGLYLFDEMNRAKREIAHLQERLQVLTDINTALMICPVCTGGGTVCDGRTEDTDMPIYNPCRMCHGRGHQRLG